jgi:hypothetical protein
VLDLLVTPRERASHTQETNPTALRIQVGDKTIYDKLVKWPVTGTARAVRRPWVSGPGCPRPHRLCERALNRTAPLELGAIRARMSGMRALQPISTRARRRWMPRRMTSAAAAGGMVRRRFI